MVIPHRPRAAAALTVLLVGCGREAVEPPTLAETTVETAAGGPAPTAPDPARSAPTPTSPTGPARLVARREVSVPGVPTGLLSADFDADGVEDLAAVLERPGGLVVWGAAQGGIASKPIAIPGGAWALGPIAHPSSEPDRPPSLVVAARDPRELRITKLGGAEPATQTFAVDGTPRALASGSLSPEGDPEIWLAHGQDHLLRFGADRGAREIALDAGRATCLLPTAAGALWVGCQEPQVLRRYDAASLAADTAEASLELPLDGIPRALLECDVDGDGDTELVGYGGDEQVWIWGLASEAPIGSEPMARFRAPGLVPLAALAVDLDGDGREELVSVHAYDTSYGVLGRFDAERQAFALRASEYAGQTPVGLAVVDLDGDGRRDLAIANRDAGRVSVLPGTGLATPEKAVFYAARRTPIGNNPLGVAVGDLDGDGALDAVGANGSDGSLSVLLGRFGLLEGRRDLSVGASPTAVRVVDVDGDGQLDLVALCRPAAGAQLALRRNRGAGEFGPLETLDLGGDGAHLATIDLAGDGAPDLVVCDPLGSRAMVVDLPFPSDGSPPSLRPMSVGARPTAAVGLASPDGRELLLVAHSSPAEVSLHAVDAGVAVELQRAPAGLEWATSSSSRPSGEASPTAAGGRAPT
ncbi:MAG: VCBS repeat-containing protein, partial [Planctomycetota bacterium]